ncbi:enoyl-CoA hydratase-related protein [Nocardioides panzhihuensis]|uniref:Enoyl-CoA hydratase/carnithine racemase n=1 Tax=Nocardioides panzhihuensis TaxID=860243 RepID=A0A7Z0DH69_9ACTN|nr:enoyl-CoA hydratase/carnithine racemase [Nocardioides panzhihuensis]
METFGLEELLDGAGDLELDPAGRPVRPLVVVDLDGADWSLARRVAERLTAARTPVLLGHATAPLPVAAAPVLDALTTTLAPDAPGRSWHAGSPGDLDRMAETVASAPLAAITFAGVLGATSRAEVADGLVVESLAYSTLLAGPEFRTWRATTPVGALPPDGDEPVLVSRTDDHLSVVLNRPQRHNAFGRGVRDALLDALAIAAHDESLHEVVLTGNGPSFCSGGDLAEFGSTPDVAAAHLVRLQQSAGLTIHRLRARLGTRMRVELHGACIGAGIEVPAFAGRIEALDGTWFQLPELGMGLIPGAGGTVSITRRVGRWRTAHMALTNRPLDLDTALAWGLVDARA